VHLAREHGGFDPKKLPKDLRVAMEGAGRVEVRQRNSARTAVRCGQLDSSFETTK
jgi:hypothetical protein